MSPELVGSLLGWLELTLGPRALAELVRRHGRGDVAELSRSDRWVSRREFSELVSIAQEMAGDERIGRDVGLVAFRAILGGPSEETLRALGSITAIVDAMADYTSKMSVGRVLTMTDTGRGRAVLEARYDMGVEVTQFNCDLTAGYFAALPAILDRLGYAVETRCQGRGDDHCRYELRWTRDPRSVDPERRGNGALSVRGISRTEQIEDHHDAAAQLAQAQSVTEVLDRIVEQVSTAIKAPGFVLAVRPAGPATPLRIHSCGVDDVVARSVGERCGTDDVPSSIVAPIVDGRMTVGHLVALLPAGTRPSSQDRRILASYARYAASALDIVAALEAARCARDTATALLGFTRRLSRATSADDVCSVIGRSMSEIIGARYAAVWLRDGNDSMRLVSGFDSTGEPYDTTIDSIDPTERTRIGILVADREPQFVTLDDVSESDRQDMLAFGVTHSLLLPLVSGDSLLGVATAAFVHEPDPADRESILERAAAVADQGAVALDNAFLNERLQHQALHDELTGLPQRVLAEDRCAHALSRRARTGETVAAMFLDLDGFKDVNDTYGHAVGDELLRAVSQRLSHLLRASDTCARIGGDEFLLILGTLDDDARATEIALRVIAAFEEPFDVSTASGHLPISVTTSVGVACATDESDFDDLLRRSDAAMYAAKRAGRNTYSFSDGADASIAE